MLQYVSRPENSPINDESLWKKEIGIYRGIYILLTYAHRSQWSMGHQRPPAIALCSGLLLSFRASWSPAVSALLQCLASNCCEAGLSSSSPAGSRSENKSKNNAPSPRLSREGRCLVAGRGTVELHLITHRLKPRFTNNKQRLRCAHE